MRVRLSKLKPSAWRSRHLALTRPTQCDNPHVRLRPGTQQFPMTRPEIEALNLSISDASRHLPQAMRSSKKSMNRRRRRIFLRIKYAPVRPQFLVQKSRHLNLWHPPDMGKETKAVYAPSSGRILDALNCLETLEIRDIGST